MQLLKEYWLVALFLILAIAFVFFWSAWDVVSYYASDAYLFDHPWIGAVPNVGLIIFFTILLYAHFKAPHEGFGANYLVVGFSFLMAGSYIYYSLNFSNVPLFVLLTLVYCFGVAVFVLLSELLLSVGFGLYLTLRRGEKWVKEIEYIYLLLGAVSIIGGMRKLSNVGNQFSGLDILSPLILTFAIAIRCIKTRAEIEGWNKLDFYKDKSLQG